MRYTDLVVEGGMVVEGEVIDLLRFKVEFDKVRVPDGRHLTRALFSSRKSGDTSWQGETVQYARMGAREDRPYVFWIGARIAFDRVLNVLSRLGYDAEPTRIIRRAVQIELALAENDERGRNAMRDLVAAREQRKALLKAKYQPERRPQQEAEGLAAKLQAGLRANGYADAVVTVVEVPPRGGFAQEESVRPRIQRENEQRAAASEARDTLERLSRIGSDRPVVYHEGPPSIAFPHTFGDGGAPQPLIPPSEAEIERLRQERLNEGEV